MDEPIRIAAYDPAWPARFEQDRDAYTEAKSSFIQGILKAERS